MQMDNETKMNIQAVIKHCIAGKFVEWVSGWKVTPVKGWAIRKHHELWVVSNGKSTIGVDCKTGDIELELPVIKNAAIAANMSYKNALKNTAGSRATRAVARKYPEAQDIFARMAGTNCIHSRVAGGPLTGSAVVYRDGFSGQYKISDSNAVESTKISLGHDLERVNALLYLASITRSFAIAVVPESHMAVSRHDVDTNEQKLHVAMHDSDNYFLTFIEEDRARSGFCFTNGGEESECSVFEGYRSFDEHNTRFRTYLGSKDIFHWLFILARDYKGRSFSIRSIKKNEYSEMVADE